MSAISLNNQNIRYEEIPTVSPSNLERISGVGVPPPDHLNGNLKGRVKDLKTLSEKITNAKTHKQRDKWLKLVGALVIVALTVTVLALFGTGFMLFAPIPIPYMVVGLVVGSISIGCMRKPSSGAFYAGLAIFWPLTALFVAGVLVHSAFNGIKDMEKMYEKQKGEIEADLTNLRQFNYQDALVKLQEKRQNLSREVETLRNNPNVRLEFLEKANQDLQAHDQAIEALEKASQFYRT